jgi:LPXTG-site transpeptidase (sortase) family protein
MSSPHPKAPFPIFLLAAIVIFGLALSAASSVGFVPYYLDEDDPRNTGSSEVALENLPELGEEIAAPAPEQEPALAPQGIYPDRIIIQEIGLDLNVSNPETRDLEELDAVLKNGPARYVDSALLNERGNVLIFGHSSHLPVVHNQMYKAFNKIPELEAGDLIAVQGSGKEFVYRVTSIEQVDAAEGIIDLSRERTKLTIVTCDTLTGKSSRFVLEAEFIGSYDI